MMTGISSCAAVRSIAAIEIDVVLGRLDRGHEHVDAALPRLDAERRANDAGGRLAARRRLGRDLRGLRGGHARRRCPTRASGRTASWRRGSGSRRAKGSASRISSVSAGVAHGSESSGNR